MDKVAQALLDIKAIFFRPNNWFTFTSGIKSPIYCDNRLALSYPKIRTFIGIELANKIKQEFPTTEHIIGVATAGIPYATLASCKLELPLGYVRGKEKSHGRANQVEGEIKSGTKVVIVEDLISTGKSTIEAVEILKELGAKVLGVVGVFTYNSPKSINAFKKHNLKHFTLTNFDSLMKTAVKNNYINSEEEKIILDWKKEFNKPDIF